MKSETFLGSTEKMESITDVLKLYELRGFTESFIPLKNTVYALSAHKCYEPHEVKIVDAYRYEGLTDPDDNAIVYALVCSDGVKGTIVDAYGVYANNILGKIKKQV